MDPTTDNSVRRLVRGAAIGLAAAAILAVGVTQLLLPDDGEARCTGSCKPPPFKARWSYQLQGNLRLTSARVYDIDGLDTPRSFVARLNRLRRYAVCYIDAGTWEDWRPDRKRFPDSVLGRDNGWPGERWLDIRRPTCSPRSCATGSRPVATRDSTRSSPTTWTATRTRPGSR